LWCVFPEHPPWGESNLLVNMYALVPKLQRRQTLLLPSWRPPIEMSTGLKHNPGPKDVVVTGSAGGCPHPSPGNEAFRAYIFDEMKTTDYNHRHRTECRSFISNLVEGWKALGGGFIQRKDGVFVPAPHLKCLRLTKTIVNGHHRRLNKKRREAAEGLLAMFSSKS